MGVLITLISFLLLFFDAHGYSMEPRQKCSEITIQMCRGIGYNMTNMPNRFGHATQEEAGLEAHQFFPLVEINCSPDLRFFLCSVYTPICLLPDYPNPLPPCRSVCERCKAGCAPLMLQYGFSWPPNLDCASFPVFGQTDELCMDSNQTDKSSTTTHHPNGLGDHRRYHPDPDHVPYGKQPYPDHVPYGKQPYPPPQSPPEIPSVDIETSNDGDRDDNLRPPNRAVDDSACNCTCRSPFKPAQGEKSSAKVIYNVSRCTYPCYAPILSGDGVQNRNFLTFWIGLWSALCCLSTFLTVLTYLIDMQRFKYPERPIIFLSFCYFMVSVGYLIRLIGGHEFVACDQNEQIRSHVTGPAQCTVVFTLVYFFGMASSVWWVVLTFTWFLAAGLKWSNEAIASYAQYFHIFSWSLPAFMSVAVLAFSAVDGDPYSGICYVGNTDVNMLRIFVIGPLFACLVLGTFFLASGFVSLFRIHNIVKQQHGLSRIEKLEKLMVRIGIFSVLYTIPATIVIGCYFYEQAYRHLWEASLVCPQQSCQVGKWNQPEFSIFIMKYFMCLVVGITSGIWIWSRKTVESWKRFLYKFCCCQSRPIYMPTEAIIIKSHTDISSGGYSRQYPLNRL